ncbi:hypothetical protein [Streptomyces sp. NPDC001137]|uniref:hypothetical protein n=1 Tax=Streptomyces sp. NPDC001137 TaxID=3154378 RepID=UPI0033281690
MDFVGGVIRLTPLDDRRHLIDRGPLVLADMKIAVETEPDSRQQVAEQWAIDQADDHPEEWLNVAIEVTDLGKEAPSPVVLGDLVVAATRTSNAAVEVWGPAAADKTWPYLVMPWVDFETMGACASSRDGHVSFGGFLFDRDWGWHSDPPTESNGLQVPFTPLLEVREGDVWATGYTDVPPPAATPRGEWSSIVEQSEWKGYIPGRQALTSS